MTVAVYRLGTACGIAVNSPKKEKYVIFASIVYYDIRNDPYVLYNSRV